MPGPKFLRLERECRHEPLDRLGRSCLSDVCCLSRLQRHPVRSDRCTWRGVADRSVSGPPGIFQRFMEKTVGFVKNYFPVFMLGAVFGKVIELSGFSKSIVSAVIGVLGRERAVLSIVVVCAILTYGGVSL